MKSICENKLNINDINRWKLSTYFMMFIGLVVRLVYVLNTSVFVRNHDVGVYTSLYDGQINPGHLGYIEYIVKFGRLPQINPFDLFSYYHPPLHHLLGALVVKVSLLLGLSYETAFENIQLFTVLIGVLCLILAYKIILFFSSDNIHTFLGMLLMIFHPSMIYMSGYVNNDMLTLLFELMCIYCTLRWINKSDEDRTLKDLIYMALSIGLGMCVKISVVLFAFPMGVVMLMYLFRVFKDEKANNTSAESTLKQYKNTIKIIKDYIIFGIISMGLGLSWTIRNLVKFHQKPGIASATPEDIKYMGEWSILRRLTIPYNFEFKYPFFNEYGSVSSNIWDIMFKTSLFGEMRPDISDFMLVICRAGLIISIFGFIVLTLLSVIKYAGIILNRGIKKRISSEVVNNKKEVGVFLLTGFLAVILSYVAFTIKYPYTCSCDFRYIIVILMYFAITLVKRS